MFSNISQANYHPKQQQSSSGTTSSGSSSSEENQKGTWRTPPYPTGARRVDANTENHRADVNPLEWQHRGARSTDKNGPAGDSRLWSPVEAILQTVEVHQPDIGSLHGRHVRLRPKSARMVRRGCCLLRGTVSRMFHGGQSNSRRASQWDGIPEYDSGRSDEIFGRKARPGHQAVQSDNTSQAASGKAFYKVLSDVINV